MIVFLLGDAIVPITLFASYIRMKVLILSQKIVLIGSLFACCFFAWHTVSAQAPEVFESVHVTSTGSYLEPSISIADTTTGIYQTQEGGLGFGTTGCEPGDFDTRCNFPVVLTENGTFVSGADTRQHGFKSQVELNSLLQLKESTGGFQGAVPLQINQWNPGSAHFEPLVFFRSRGESVGSTGVVEPGDTIGLIQMVGDDGSGPNGESPIAINLSGQVDRGCDAPSPGIVPTLFSILTMDDTGSTNHGLTVDCNQDVLIPNGSLLIREGPFTLQHEGVADAVLFNVATPATAGNVASLIFRGRDTGDAGQEYASLLAQSTDVTAGSEDGRLRIHTVVEGQREVQLELNDGVVIPRSGVRTPQGNGTLNITGPFYIGDTPVIDENRNASFASLSVENFSFETFSVGTDSPQGVFHIAEGNSGALVNATADELVLESAASGGMSILTPNNAYGRILFSDPESPISGRIEYNHTDDSMTFRTNNTPRMTLSGDGNIGIRTTNPTALFSVGDNSAFQVNNEGAVVAGVWQADAIDISDSTNLDAGRSLTLTDDTLSVDAEFFTDSRSLILRNPTDGDDAIAQTQFVTGVTITRVSCSTDVGAVTIELDERNESTPNAEGSSVLTSTLTCDADSEATTALNDASISAGSLVNLDIETVSGTPGVVRVFVEYTIDEG